MKRFVSKILATFLLMAVTITPLTANAVESRKSFGYKWDNTPRTVNYYCTFTGSEKTAVQNAMNTWNNVKSATTGGNMVTMAISNNKRSECSIEMVNDASLPLSHCEPDVLGYSILGMAIYFNQAYGISIGATTGKYDLQSLATHELGHSIGIKHCHESGETCISSTCTSNAMNPVAELNSTSRRNLQLYDTSSYQYIYR